MRDRLSAPLSALVVALSIALPAARAAESGAPPRIVTTAEPAGGYIVVTAPTAGVAAGPSDEAAVFGEVRKGDILPLKGRQGGWYFVATGESSLGWIRTDAAAIFFYPEFLPAYRPPASLVAPPAEPPPPPYPYSWYGRSRGWDRPPQWGPWWGFWFGLDDDRRFGRDRDRRRGRGPWHDGDDDRDHDWDRDRDDRGRSWQ